MLSECSGDMIEIVASKTYDKQYRIEDLTPWGRDKMAIARPYFQMHLLEWKCINFE